MKKLTEEHKFKLRLAKLGKKHTAEHNINISKGCMGRVQKVSTKEIMGIKKLSTLNPNWKGGVSHYRNVHLSIVKKHGKAAYCENKVSNLFDFPCKEISIKYDWAKKRESEYTKNKDDYYQLCHSCHRIYDLCDK